MTCLSEDLKELRKESAILFCLICTELRIDKIVKWLNDLLSKKVKS